MSGHLPACERQQMYIDRPKGGDAVTRGEIHHCKASYPYVLSESRPIRRASHSTVGRAIAYSPLKENWPQMNADGRRLLSGLIEIVFEEGDLLDSEPNIRVYLR